MIKNLFFNLFGNLLFSWFLRLGKLFFNTIAVKSDVSAAHFARSDWHMYQSMEDYIEDDDFHTTNKQNKGKDSD
tara:strand:+ start:213 stop:434 length:222 start_codon:yes stop_codon:yes gene_type:complete